jgi:ribosome-associated protein
LKKKLSAGLCAILAGKARIFAFIRSGRFPRLLIQQMTEKRFVLTTAYIELIKLLKLLHIAESGAHAKILVEEGKVMLNGNTEYRKRAKLRPGDVIICHSSRIIIEG